jgi:SAM-dependent methyltransferase
MTVSTYDDIAEWYDNWVGAHAMREDAFFPAVEALMGEVAGRRICDLACGQGRVARHLADRGAFVVGIDLSAKLLAIARRQEEAAPRGIDYRHADARGLDAIALAVDILAGRGSRSLQLMFQIQLVIPFAALGEEFGWRGYALPRLQKLYRPLPAALILGVVWAFWHLPYFVVAGNYPSPAALYFIPFAIGIVASSVLISWIYNSTGGSLPATILYHAALNIAVAIPQSDGLGGLWVNTSIFALCALIVALSSPVFRRAVSGTCVMRSSESDA